MHSAADPCNVIGMCQCEGINHLQAKDKMPASNVRFSGPMNGNSDTALRKAGLRRATAQ